MLKTLFQKLFVLYMGILLISFILLSLILSQVFETYFMYQKEKLLLEQGEKISKQYAMAYYTGVVDHEKLNFEMEILDKYLNARIWFVDAQGQVYIESSTNHKAWIGQKLTEKEIKTVFDGYTITIKGRFGGRFTEQVLTVGYPVAIKGKVQMALFMHAPIPEIQKTVSEVYRITLYGLILSSFVAFILIYLLAQKITKPLQEMNEAAKVIAGGDFHRRLSVKGHDEIGELAESFNYMAEALNHLEEIRRRFIANLSHDLRSPLTSIQGFVQAILDGTVPQDKQDRYLNIVLDESKRLTKLTNDILDLTKMESGEITLEKTMFDIHEVIRKVLARFEARAGEKNLKVELQLAREELMVFADIEKIQRVLFNLMDNAVKFTPDQRMIKIQTTLVGSKVQVALSDTGIGIADEDLKYIWDRFFKGDQSRGQYKKGTGLGLAIVKEIIKHHGETIYVKSDVGVGTVFFFTLPIA